jgi:chromate transporter
MLLPGPEAQQLAIYIGWLLHRTRGGIVAGALFVIPSMFVLWTLSYVYAAFGHLPSVAAIFYGLKPAVTAIIIAALLRIGRKALKNEVMWGLALAAFVAIFFLKAPFPFIVFCAGFVGLAGGRFWPGKFCAGANPELSQSASVLGDTDDLSEHTRPSWPRALRISITCLLLWWAPTLLAGFCRGWDSTLFHEGLFFSKAAVVTFGGAYAVLPYVAQQAVNHYGWLQPGQMLDGLGLAETTPGPLIMVLQFVGFMGAWQHPDGWPPLLAATAGALLTTWVTFMPCFLWVLAAGPSIERLRGNARLAAALSAVTAAVVGVILNLAVWFALQVFFPDRQVDWVAAAICAIALFGLWKWNWNVIPVVLGSGLAGWAVSALVR